MANPRYTDMITQHCGKEWDNTWFAIEIVILITGVVTNTALLWIFLRERKSLSVSQVLGVNLVAMDLIYLSFMPVHLMYATYQPVNNSATTLSKHTNGVEVAKEIVSMFNLIGCPLLLACMCIERYLAVVRPVLYLRVRRWEYRMAVSAAVWCATLSCCLATGLMDNAVLILMSISFITSCLFIIMLACLGGVIWSLRQQSPAHTRYGNQVHSPLKRQAMVNVLVVVVPAVISYLPVLVIAPLALCVLYRVYSLGQNVCNVFELSVLFPNFGVFIGPLFYLSKARQMCCLSGTGKKFNE